MSETKDDGGDRNGDWGRRGARHAATMAIGGLGEIRGGGARARTKRFGLDNFLAASDAKKQGLSDAMLPSLPPPPQTNRLLST